MGNIIRYAGVRAPPMLASNLIVDPIVSNCLRYPTVGTLMHNNAIQLDETSFLIYSTKHEIKI